MGNKKKIADHPNAFRRLGGTQSVQKQSDVSVIIDADFGQQNGRMS